MTGAVTEHEWLTIEEAYRLVNQMRGESDRKLRLVGCALCRTLWPQLPPISRRAVEVAEQVADGLLDKRTRFTYDRRAHFACERAGAACPHPMWMAAQAVSQTGWYAAELTVGCSADARLEAEIVRCIFGNPFRPVSIVPAWRTTTVLSLAQAIYEERAFDRLPILADALEDAGCTNPAILGHCRGPGLHVRGCWVVDLLLGKE